jgi:hypothetical protein
VKLARSYLLCSKQAGDRTNSPALVLRRGSFTLVVHQPTRTTANNYDIEDLTLPGGGQGFESPRLHL